MPDDADFLCGGWIWDPVHRELRFLGPRIVVTQVGDESPVARRGVFRDHDAIGHLTLPTDPTQPNSCCHVYPSPFRPKPFIMPPNPFIIFFI